MDPTLAYRAFVLSIADRALVQRLVTTRGWSFARRFVAGTTQEEALQAIHELEAKGVHGILDLLGEMATDPEEARRAIRLILELVQATGELPFPRYVSVKPSQIGMDVDRGLFLDGVRSILEAARERDCFIRLDMEDSPRVDATLETYRTMRSEGFDGVGLVFQSYLRRAGKDLEELRALKPDIRMVKGAYKEPTEVAFQDMATVNERFIELCQANLEAGCRTAIATHDEGLIQRLKTWLKTSQIDPELYEFQFLYGIRRDLQLDLAQEGYRVRTYIAFGDQWYPYFSRRIAERPANLIFVLKALLKG